jgi:hemerythrin-like domain-containing protein
MQPIDPLMAEHRLIERLMFLLRQDLERVRNNMAIDPEFAFVDPVFIDQAVDFLSTYADRCHHGKEEDIFFAALAEKELTPELKNVMAELIAEHQEARELTRSLLEAKNQYLRQDKDAVSRMLYCISKLTAMYPKHVLQEDQYFFVSCLKYFTPAEGEALLARMAEFDRRLIHEKYQDLVHRIETRRACGVGGK